MIQAIAQLGEPVLKTVAQPVDQFGDALTALLSRMEHTMLAANGVGIAAPQIFVSQRALIIASRPNPRYPDAPSMAPLALINPEIVQLGGEWSSAFEGCLSVPGIRGRVRRRNEVTVRYQDAQGHFQQSQFSGFAARIFLHEYDHLEGRTFLDQIQSSDDLIATSVLEQACSSA
ncbi:peptide deformylase [Ferrimonas pelagia]|uniref:Peptide deformylase n=1 Tax=Ferrimonas pelagia TaxID=1177826 RepID=A0ABP9EYS0_9GAMM